MPRCDLTTVGITGTIGSGKSTVGKILQDLKIPVIDSDEIVHNLLSSDSETQNLVVDRFGTAVLLSGKTSNTKQIDRKALGRIVFQDPQSRRDLENIIHPRVRATYKRKLQEYAGDPSIKIVAALVPLLFEANLAADYDQTWAVTTNDEVLRKRLRARDNFTDGELESRLASQWTQEKKASLADKVIDNSRDLESTRAQVLNLVDQLTKRDGR